MTTATMVQSNRTMATQPRPSLEELVDRVIAALFKEETEPAAPVTTATQSVARSVHEARRLRQTGNFDGALTVFAGMDTAEAETREARWAYAEWMQLVKRRFVASGRARIQPGHGTGRSTGSDGRWGAPGRGGPGDALAARQDRLAAQSAGVEATGEGTCVMVAANVDIPALKARLPPGRHGGGVGRQDSGEGAGSARASAPFTTRRRAASRCTPTRNAGTASAAGSAETCWTSSRGRRT